MLAAAAPQKKISGAASQSDGDSLSRSLHSTTAPSPYTYARRIALCLGLISRFSYSFAYKSFEASLPPAAIHPAYTRHTNLP